MVDFVFGSKSVVITPVEVHLAEDIVALERAAADPWMRFVFDLNQHWN